MSSARSASAFYREEVALTRIRSPGLNICHVSPLSPLLTAILDHLGLSATVYTSLAASSTQCPQEIRETTVQCSLPGVG